MVSSAHLERAALSDLFDQVGPDQPTLCAGWTTADLAAHLVIRERRPDAAAGVVLGPLRGYTEKVRLAERSRPFAEVVARVRHGVPRWSPLALPALDSVMNTVEFYVHHEDVRRAQPDWEPRELGADRERELWAALRRVARLTMRRAPTGVRLVAPGNGAVTSKTGEPTVTLTGPPSELVLYAFGRQSAARVEATGDPDAVSRLENASLGA